MSSQVTKKTISEYLPVVIATKLAPVIAFLTPVFAFVFPFITPIIAFAMKSAYVIKVIEVLQKVRAFHTKIHEKIFGVKEVTKEEDAKKSE